MLTRAFKYRIYPNEEQKTWLAQSFGNARFLWNYMLALRIRMWKEQQVTLSRFDCDKLLPALKEEYEWLANTPSQALQQVNADLDLAFKAFFKNIKINRVVSKKRNKETSKLKNPYGFPQFHKKGFHKKGKCRDSFCIKNQNDCIRIEDNRLRIPKCPGTLKVVWSRQIEGNIKRITIERDKVGDYFVSILCDNVCPDWVEHKEYAIGIDMGIKTFVTLSTGEIIEGQRELQKALKKLRRLQRKLSRKDPESNNYKKLQCVIAKLHRRIARLRRDFQDKLTTLIAKTYEIVCVEDLSTKWWWKVKSLVKKAMDYAPGQFLRLLKEKCEKYGSAYIAIDKFYPSTQLCSACGTKAGPKGREGLGVREWDCPQCKTHHDRDVNAAINIKQEGLRMLKETRGCSSLAA